MDRSGDLFPLGPDANALELQLLILAFWMEQNIWKTGRVFVFRWETGGEGGNNPAGPDYRGGGRSSKLRKKKKSTPSPPPRPRAIEVWFSSHPTVHSLVTGLNQPPPLSNFFLSLTQVLRPHTYTRGLALHGWRVRIVLQIFDARNTNPDTPSVNFTVFLSPLMQTSYGDLSWKQNPATR
jgi:hypothetical protein